jgi:orotidine-5'-phosphate decarboxylase
VANVLGPKGVKFKIGSIAFTKFGPQFVKEFVSKRYDIFLDLKLHDIPNTMAQTASVIAELGVWAFTVHLAAGKEALQMVRVAVNNTAKKLGKNVPFMLGVTVLTSSTIELDEREIKIKEMAALAQKLGLDGVIASPLDVKKIKAIHKDKLLVVTPGIRNPQDESQDQRRVSTAKQAFFEGADYIVVGRSIIGKADYLAAAEETLSC